MITVTLTEREARALALIANLFAGAFEGEYETLARRGVDPPVPPLVSAAMRLELALVAEGVEG